MTTAEVDWLVKPPDRASPDFGSIWRRGTLLIHGLEYFAIAPPRIGLKELRNYAPDQMHSSITDDNELAAKRLHEVSADALRHTLYMGYWESFIYFAGISAEVSPDELMVREMGAE